jgi:hypothetical protein
MTFFTYQAEDTLLPQFDYEFYVWPHESVRLSTETIDLLYRNQMRHVLTCNEKEWSRYRARVEQDGLTFREVTRSPHVEPEIVR